MFDLTFWLILCLTLPLSHAIYFSGTGSYAVYQTANLRSEVTISFKIKTDSDKYSLLMYAGSYKQNTESYIAMILNRGQIIIRVQASNPDQDNRKEKTIPIRLNDFQWHSITLIRNYRSTTVIIDDISRVVTIEGDSDELDIDSNVYFAGLPENIKTNILDDAIRLEASFSGCIENINYGLSNDDLIPLKLISKRDWGMTSKCSINCERYCSTERPCGDEWKSMRGCPCYIENENLETSTCFKDLTSPESKIYSFDGSAYVTRQLESTIQSVNSLTVSFALKTIEENGVIVSMGKKNDYLLVEMYQSLIRVELNAGGGTLVVRNKRPLSDGTWHTIWIKRSGKTLTLYIDNVFVASTVSRFPSIVSCEDGDIDLLYVGGHFQPSTVVGSLSETNFIGCIQQLQSNKIYILDNVYSMKTYGAIIRVCQIDPIKLDWKSSTKANSSITATEIVSPVSKEVTPLKIAVEASRNQSKSTTTWIAIAIIACSFILIVVVAVVWYRVYRTRRGTFLAKTITTAKTYYSATRGSEMSGEQM